MRIVVTFHSYGRECAGHQAAAADLVVGALERRGHAAEALDVSDSLGHAVAQLEELDPELVFNLSRGRGRHGDLLFPAVLEQLDLPFTGTDAQTSAVIRDKRLAKMLVETSGVATPPSVFTRQARDVPVAHLAFPVVVKPNYEEDHSDQVVVPSPSQLRSTLSAMLDHYPEGVLIEEYVSGVDLTMTYLESHAPYLPAPIGYRHPADVGTERYPLYDHHLRQLEPDKIELVVGPELTPGITLDDVTRTTLQIVSALGLRDAGEIQLRVTPMGELYFLHANQMPRLDQAAPIYAAAKKLSCDVDDVIDAIVRSAERRHGEPSSPRLSLPHLEHSGMVSRTR